MKINFILLSTLVLFAFSCKNNTKTEDISKKIRKVEAYYHRVNGVIDATVGYTGGNTENPTYDDVCNGNTGHAEAVRIEFDPDIVTYQDLLKHFFRIHDPTSQDRQGNDTGSQYRSAIFYYSEQQRKEAEKEIERLNNTRTYKKSIVTGISPAIEFYPAEEYHQRYQEKNPHGYCHIDLNLA